MNIVFLNNNYIDDKQPIISHHDSGFATGIGIFDSMLMIHKKPIHIQEHFERIIHDSKIVIGLTPSISLKDFEKICDKLVKQNNIKESYIRIRTTVTGGIASAPLSHATELTLLIEARATLNPDTVKPAQCVIIKNFPRIAGCVLENCKRLDYSRSYAARRMAESMGGDEAILTNTDGNIACGTTSNIFIEENEVLVTPPLSDGVLAGVTRHKLIEERDVREESISIERLKSAKKVFLTNSFIGLRNVILVN